MKIGLREFWTERRERIGDRLRRGPQKRYFRCPRCHAVLTAPAGRGRIRLTCSRCGEIFLRRT